MNSVQEMHTQLLEKAAVDDAFRDKLVANPKGAIFDELGIEVPQDIEVKVHENDMNTIHLSLPATDIPEEQLEAIAAGRCCCCF